MSHLVIVDFSNIVHTCYHPAIAAQQQGQAALELHVTTCGVCSLGDPCPSRPKQYDPQQVFRTNLRLKTETLSQAIHVPVKQWIFVKDGSKQSRLDLFPEYKSGRTPMTFDAKSIAEEFWRNLGCKFAICPTTEADDSIATIVRASRPQFDIIIVSSDADLWTLYDPPGISIYLPTSKEWLGPARIEKKFGFTNPKFIRLHKTFFGDSSDHIPNLMPRMQKSIIPIILASDGGLDSVLGPVYSGQASPKAREMLIKNEIGVKRNWELVGLNFEADIEWL